MMKINQLLEINYVYLVQIMYFRIIFFLNMKKSLLIFCASLFFVFNVTLNLYANDNLKLSIQSVKEGIKDNSISKFSNIFGDNCYLSLNNGTIGYFTKNQIYYIMENYFEQNKIKECELDSPNFDGNIANVAGKISYIYNGVKYTTDIYLSFKNISEKWYISQLIIN